MSRWRIVATWDRSDEGADPVVWCRTGGGGPLGMGGYFGDLPRHASRAACWPSAEKAEAYAHKIRTAYAGAAYGIRGVKVVPEPAEN